MRLDAKTSSRPCNNAGTTRQLSVGESASGIKERVSDLEYTKAELEQEIAQYRQTEETLQDRIRYLQSLIEKSSDGILVTDSNRTISYRHLPVAFDDIHPDDWERALESLARVAQEPGAKARTEVRVRHKDGSWSYVEVTAINHLHDPDVKGVVMFFHDITEHKQSEVTLKNHSRYFQALIERSSDGILVIDSNGMIRYRHLPMAFENVHPDDVKKAINSLTRISEEPDGKVLTEVRVQHRDGSWHYAEVTGTSYMNDPDVKGMVLSFRDVTDRKQVEEALHKYRDHLEEMVEARTNELMESEEQYSNLFHQSNDAIFLCDTEGNILEANYRAADVFGYTNEELGTMKISEIWGPRMDEQAKYANDRLAKDGFVNFEIDFRRKSGEIMSAEVSSSLLEIGGTKIVQGIVHDITQRKNAEIALRRYTDELEQFAFIASHDLMEPLRIVKIYAQFLAKQYKGKLDSDADEFIDYVTEGTSRMQALLDALRDYACLNASVAELDFVDCEVVLDNAIANLRPEIEEHRAEVTHDRLPKVMGSTRELIQLFENLINNAVKFRSDKQPIIHISAESRGLDWLFSVRDNGIGIESQYIDQIFVVFKHLNLKEDYPGIGMGLTLCKRIVERHNGSIWVESEPGQGSTFFFSIPKPRGASDLN
ncbi:MAG: PAS domain S-box protein [Chloroflexota bacterium]|nr:PAS domain S-box protein [Chloroflexota bacterium]